MALLSLAPYSLVHDKTRTPLEQLLRRFEGWASFAQLTAWDVWTNLFLYAPFAWCLLYHHGLRKQRAWKQAAIVGFISLAVSATLESAQAFLTRFPSLADVLLNTAGAVLAVMSAIVVRPVWVALRGMPILPRGFGLWHRIGTTLCAGLILMLFVIPLPLTEDYRGWSSEFELVIGGGSNLEHPAGWTGTLHAITVHQRELPRWEILAKYQAGLSAKQDTRDSGVAFHDDLSHPARGGGDARWSSRPRYQIYASDHCRLDWMQPRGLAIQGTNVTLSVRLELPVDGGPFYPHREFTVEGWIAQEHGSPWPVARLVSYSPRTVSEGLGLARNRLEHRLTLGPMPPAFLADAQDVMSPEHVIEIPLHHVVGTYHDGTTKTYLDGVMVSVARQPVGKALIDLVPDYFGDSYTPVAASLAILPLLVCAIHWTSCASGANTGIVSLFAMGTILAALLAVRSFALRGPFEGQLAASCSLTMVAAVAVYPVPAKTRRPPQLSD